MCVALRALIYGALIALVACGKPSASYIQARSASSTVWLEILDAPESNAEIGEEGYIISGILHAPATFRGTSPLVFQVQNLETGWHTPPRSLTEPVGGEFSGDTYFNDQTGEFLLDGRMDFVLRAGPKKLTLWGCDATDHCDEWSAEVTVANREPIAPQDFIGEREAFLVQVADLASRYSDFLSEQQFDTVAFPYADLDIMLAFHHASFWQALATDPAGGTWRAAAHAFEAAIADSFDRYPIQYGVSPTAAEEALWRGVVADSVGWERWVVESNEDIAVGAEAGPASPGWLQQSSAWYRQNWMNYYAETHVDSSYSTGVGQDQIPFARFEARIYQSEGVGNTYTWKYTDPANLVPDSADPDEPVWLLVAALFDTDLDGFMDSIVFDGLCEGSEPEDEPEALWDTDHYYPLVTPLRYLFETRYLCKGGF